MKKAKLAHPQNHSSDAPDLFRRDNLLRLLLTIVVAAAGLITAYHATIYGLKEQLATKADQHLVGAIDSRLVHIEAILNERVATKTELRETRDHLNQKLLGIEAKLRLLPEEGR